MKRLIDANDFLDLFYIASAGQDKAFIETVEMVAEETPTVDAVEVVHGRWMLKERAHYFKCSVCKEPIPYKFGYDNSRRYYNYCPNCGAKMDEKGER